ncbi:L-lactate permease [Saccharopolyspora sp. K220]|uniref:L-lactate permease n=1 Tax=Saccharopolyspora soli TaxID=2926618 RepID=UPI001F573F61|nr:L-lactate permease [Saccharopolyspora soli]MCI2423217.1 L-lactate permease [Saccharopolyspora soli]
MYQQILDPLFGSLGWSALAASLPLLVLFALLGIVRMTAWKASLIALLVALAIAIFIYPMPVDQAVLSATLGAAFGFFPILWIVINAIWIYNMTVATGHFDVLQRSFSRVSSDRRIQAVIIAFCFGALLEALAGFGTPVAITTVMLLALGFSPITSAVVALVANTAPVAFGALASPLVTLASVTGLPLADLGAMTGRQTPLLAVFVPLVLVGIIDGFRGVRQTLPATLVCGVSFAIAQFVAANYVSVPLTDIIAALVAAGATVLLLRVWTPPGATEQAAPEADGHGQVFRAYVPYLIIIAVFVVAQIGPIARALDVVTLQFSWPGLDIRSPEGKPLSLVQFKFNWLTSAGSLLLIAGLLTIPAIGIRARAAVSRYLGTYVQLKWPIVTVMSVLAIAYVMNASGQTATLGTWMAAVGGLFALISPILGWLGVAVTGSDTSSNSLFGALQVAAAQNAGIDPLLAAAANGSGGVLGKMISPQNLAIAAGAVGMTGREGDIFRRVLPWSVAFLALMCVLVYLQSLPVLAWMTL